MVLSAAMLVSLTSIPPVEAKTKKATLASKKISLYVGKKKTISIKNKKKGATYIFKATNKKITVSKKGKITAKKVGTAKVKVSETYKAKQRKEVLGP